MTFNLKDYQNKIAAVEESIENLQQALTATEVAMYKDFCQSMIADPEQKQRIVLQFYEDGNLLDTEYWQAMTAEQAAYKLYEWAYSLQYRHLDKKVEFIENLIAYNMFYIEKYQAIGYTDTGTIYRSCKVFIVQELPGEYQSK